MPGCSFPRIKIALKNPHLITFAYTTTPQLTSGTFKMIDASSLSFLFTIKRKMLGVSMFEQKFGLRISI